MKFLIFRTDRVGDFLLSLSLIKIIKNNYPDSEITLIASPRNCEYIKTFNVVDRLLILKNNLLSKIKIILALRKIKFDSIIVHDAKNRSKFISYFLQSKKKIDVKPGTSDTQMDIIKIICNSLSLKYDLSCLNFLDNRKHVNINRPFGKYIHHRKIDLNDWFLYSIDSPITRNARGFSRGSIFSKTGDLVASCTQEGLIRLWPEKK